MKRLMLSALLGMAALGLSAGTAKAGLWECFGFCNPCCSKCGANFCVRQYNAFSPVACGTIYCDGFNPICSPCIAGGPGSCCPPCGFCPPCGCAAYTPPMIGMYGEGIGMPKPVPGNMPQQLPPPSSLPMPQPGATLGMMGYPPYMMPGMMQPMMQQPMMPVGYNYPPPYDHGYMQPAILPSQAAAPQQ